MYAVRTNLDINGKRKRYPVIQTRHFKRRGVVGLNIEDTSSEEEEELHHYYLPKRFGIIGDRSVKTGRRVGEIVAVIDHQVYWLPHYPDASRWKYGRMLVMRVAGEERPQLVHETMVEDYSTLPIDSKPQLELPPREELSLLELPIGEFRFVYSKLVLGKWFLTVLAYGQDDAFASYDLVPAAQIHTDVRKAKIKALKEGDEVLTWQESGGDWVKARYTRSMRQKNRLHRSSKPFYWK